MTLHSQTPFNFHNEHMGRDLVMPALPLQRWTAEQTRALEDWWLAKMPRAGKSRAVKPTRSTQCFRHLRHSFTTALQDWVTRQDLIAVAGGNINATTGYLNARYKRDHIEKKRFDGEDYYRLTDEAKAFGFRFSDPAPDILNILDDWKTSFQVAAEMGCNVNYVKVEIGELIKEGRAERTRKSEQYYYKRAGV